MCLFELVGNIPSERDKLMMLVMGVMRMSMHSLTIVVGHGSSLQDLLGEEEISFLTSSSVTGEKADNLGGV